MKIQDNESLPSESPKAELPFSNADELPVTATPESDAAETDVIFTGTERSRTGISLNKGDLLDDRFIIVEILGSEGVSTDYKAIDRNQSASNKERHVIIKVLKREYQSTLGWVVALAKAARKCQNLDHPNIAKIYGFHREGTRVYLHMEYLSGESLRQKIRCGVKRFPAKQAVHIVNEIGRALAYAHEHGVVHHDLKPANVFLTDSGDVKVIDFGIAQVLRRTAKDDTDAPHFRSDNHSVATPSYSDHDLLGLSNPDPCYDVYALACIAYELLAGRHPFEQERVTGAQDTKLELKPSEAFTRAQWISLQEALAFDRDKRTPTVAEFLTSFNASTNWVRGVSLAAGVGVFSIVVGLFIYGQIPVREKLVESEMAKTPILLEHSDSNQLDPRAPELITDVVAELTTEAHSPTDDQSTSGQVKLQLAAEKATEGVTRLAEQAPRTHGMSSPAPDDTASTTAVGPQPDIPSTQPLVYVRVSDSDELTQMQPTAATPAQVDGDSPVAVGVEHDIQSAESVAETNRSATNEPKQVQPTVTISTQVDGNPTADVDAVLQIESVKSVTDTSVSETDEPKQMQPITEVPAQVEVDSPADIKAEPQIQSAESVANTRAGVTKGPSQFQPSVTASADRDGNLPTDAAAVAEIQTTDLGVDTSARIDESVPVEPLPKTMTTATQSKAAVVKTGELAANTKVLPEVIAEKELPGTAGNQSADASAENSAEGTTSTATETQARDMSSLERQVANLLALAENQVNAKRLSLPAGNNALVTYREVLRLLPDNEGQSWVSKRS